MRAHLDEKIDALMASGSSREEAARTARREFWQWSSLERLFADLRFAFRLLGKPPGFTAVAVLALGTGANTTILSVISALILRKPPVHDPDGLLVVTSKNPANVFQADMSAVSAADYLDWRDQAADFASLAAAASDDFTISGNVDPQLVPGARVSANFFPVMEVQPLIGGPFLPGDDPPGRDKAVLISALGPRMSPGCPSSRSLCNFLQTGRPPP